MKLVRCNNGHFYDQDKYGTCPNCNNGGNVAESLTEAVVLQDMPGEVDVTHKLQASLLNPAESAPRAADVTKPLRESQGGQVMEGQAFSGAGSQSGAGTFSGVGNQLGGETPVIPNVDIRAGRANSMDVYNSIAGQDEPDDDYTRSMTVGGKKMGAEGLKPAVGWLVCLSGKHIGKDFRLVQGKNYIGRNASMDVCLENEMTVSREKHAVLVYEPKHHIYLVQSGDSKELTYVNDKVTLESRELRAYDEILVGDVKLLFVPLCGDRFNWTDQLEGAAGKKGNSQRGADDSGEENGESDEG